jgi:diguanylate cyclase (GGDEF)-like protein
LSEAILITPMLPSLIPPLTSAPAAPRKLRSALASALRNGEVESAASFGRWWCDADSGQIVLSTRAAQFLEVEAGLHRSLENCLIQVVPEDVLGLMAALSQVHSTPVDCEFRIANAQTGLRWLQMQSLAPAAAHGSVRMGVLTDITAAKHAALRERFSFESTQILVGTRTLESAVTRVIQLVCENLGWEWGAFWAAEPDADGATTLACRHFWHLPHSQLNAFTRDSQAVRMGPGEGLVGQVWGSGEAGWVEAIASHPTFLRRQSAAECGLLSGYAFPVAYVGADGKRRSPGVLEFFSTLARQREAQLPNLSMAIGALIAQTDERCKQQERIAQLSALGAGVAPAQPQLAGMMEAIEEVQWTFEVPGWGISYVSPAVERVYGQARQAFYDDPHLWLKSVHPADRARVMALSGSLLEGESQSFQYRIVRPDQEVRWIRYEARFIAGALAGSGRVESVGIDISVQHRLEESLRRCHRALDVIRDCEQVIAASRDERALLQGVCNRLAVGYRMAWVAVLDGAAGALSLAGITGAHQDYLDCLGSSLAAGAAGEGSIGAALRSRRPVVVNDFARDARMAPWRSAAERRGFRAKVALPMVRHDEALGILNIYSVEHDAFDSEEVALLQGLAERVSAAIQTYRYHAARHHAQAALRLRERALEYQAHYDTLTGLPNRVRLYQRLAQAIADPFCPAWLVYLDLDRFKLVNDSLGHKAGDIMLKHVAKRLRAVVKPADTVARVGGDEYVMILSAPGGGAGIASVLQDILAAVAQPVVIQGHEFFPTCSMGVAAWPSDGADEAALMRHADIAMYRAKELGRNTYQFYSSAMNARTLERLRLESELRHALERDEFVLHYQPQVALDSGRIVGMEALVRWNHPELGMVPPDQFIGLAEETGLIVAIGDWVLRTACAQTLRWQRAGYPGLRVAVNLSARQFAAQDLASSIRAVLAATGLAADCLDFELTESSLMADVDSAVASMHELKALGVQLSIDDFGTGYSSLAYLKRFPIDVLKIDKSFVRDVMADAADAAIVTSIIALAHNLKLHVIAEGVETAEQLVYLRQHGCDDVQGYYFSRPVPAAAFERLLAAPPRSDHAD